MSSLAPRPARSLRSGPPSPLLPLPSPSMAGPSTRRRSFVAPSPMTASHSTPATGPLRRAPLSPASPTTRMRAPPSPIVSSSAMGHKAKAKVTPRTGGTSAETPKVTRHKRQTSSLSAIPSPAAPKAATILPPASAPSTALLQAKSPRKPKAPEKRVLPARIRRAAGAGDGVRDLEDMIVDWLERYCEPCTTPPETLIIHLTTLPEHLVEPPISPSEPIAATKSVSSPVPDPQKAKEETERAQIEVPSWRMVLAGEDDEEEAREEVLSRGARGPKGLLSPVKRLRTALVGHEASSTLEDTSDAYYISLHKKYEVFERKQRLREKEKLQYERHKMRSRVELLRTMSIMGWTTLVSTVLARPVPPAYRAEDWDRGMEKVKREGAGWLRDVLVREGQEVLERYDFLLPVEARRQKGAADSRNGTPTPSSIAPSPSVSPPPVLNARVAALRDAKVESARKRQASPLSASATPKNTSQSRRGSETQTRTGSSRKRKRAAVDVSEHGQSNSRSSPLSEDEDDEPIVIKVARTNGRADRGAKRIPNGSAPISTPTIIKTRPTRPSSIAASTPITTPLHGATRSSRRTLLSPSKDALAPRPLSDGSSISPDEIRDMREVEASVVI